jgi:hypothetical protein
MMMLVVDRKILEDKHKSRQYQSVMKCENFVSQNIDFIQCYFSFQRSVIGWLVGWYSTTEEKEEKNVNNAKNSNTTHEDSRYHTQ